MKKNIIFRTTAAVLLLSLSAAGVCAAAEATAEKVPETAAAETQEIRLVGSDDKDAMQMKLTNKTGKDIVYISICEYDEDAETEAIREMQEALIEQKFLDDVADGSYGPKTQAAVIAFREAKGLSAEDLADTEMLTLLYGEYDDGNLLKDKEVIKNEETVILSWESEDADDEDAAADQFVLNPDFRGLLKLADEETEYVLHTIPTEPVLSAEIMIEEDIAYLVYQTEGSEAPISTLEQEKAAIELENQTYYSDDYYYADDYYADDYYDYSEDYYYDDSYYYEEPQGVDGCIDIDDALLNP